MKQLFLSVTLLSLYASQASAQAVVSAPVLETQAGIQNGLQKAMKLLSSAANKLVNQGVGEQEMTKMFSEQNMKMAKDWYDGLQQVSGAVRDYRRVASIFDTQTRIITTYSAGIEVMRKSPYVTPKQLSTAMTIYGKMLAESSSTMSDLSRVVSPAIYKMTDAERLRFIDQLDAKITKQYALVDYYTRRNMEQINIAKQKEVDEKSVLALMGNQ
jgi:RecA/RadA recombinase